MKNMLLLVILCTSPVLVASIDYRNLTWGGWEKEYTSVETYADLSRMYRAGPRVRAKILVGEAISMNDFQAGEAIFRQQILNVVRVERVERVQLEYLQTDVSSEEAKGRYYVALGISALPPPLGSSGNYYDSDPSALIDFYIDAERERIARCLRYGNIVTSVNVTIDSLQLFGTPMTLVDMSLEGETFTQVYLKPWVGVQLVIASTISLTMDTSVSESEHYTIYRDAFQDLRLRFIISQRLRSLHVRASDIIVHSPTKLLPYTIYYADAGVLEIEIHLQDIYADLVETKLLGNNSLTSSNVVETLFNEMEPDWRLIAMEVNTKAGQLFSEPSGASILSGTGSSTSTTISELTFALYNISFAQLERAKWAVLECIRNYADQVAPSMVRFGRITFPSSSFDVTIAIDNDGDKSLATINRAFASESKFDPVNAINWTLSFKVEPKTSGSFNSVVLTDHINRSRSDIEGNLQSALGFTLTNDALKSWRLEFISASDWVGSGPNAIHVTDPYVSVKLTLRVEPLDASGTVLKSPNFFQLHYVRCALSLLLQQVAIVDDDLVLIAASVVDRILETSDSTSSIGYTWDSILYIKYKVFISDESQRNGIRSVIFSPRLASTISLYALNNLELIEREINLHADGSPKWPEYLPGTLDFVPEVDTISDGFLTSSKILLSFRADYVYEFGNPLPIATSGSLQNANDVCAPGVTGTSGFCIRIHFASNTQLAPMFLRKLQSIHPAVSSSINLPPAHSSSGIAVSSPSYPAPWVMQSVGGETLWSFFVDRSMSSDEVQSFRLTFAAVNSMEELSATVPFTVDLEYILDNQTSPPIVRRRQFLDLASMYSSDLPSPAFITAEVPELIKNGDTVAGIAVKLNLEEPRLGGLYSYSLLNEVAPGCIECTVMLPYCNGLSEYRAFSACTSLLLETDLTLIATMLKNDAVGTSIDVTWLLQDCLSPSDGTEWSSSMRYLLTWTYACLWSRDCPLAYTQEAGKKLAVRYTPGEQVLTFDLTTGLANISFSLDTDDGKQTYNFVEDFTAVPTDVAAQLNEILTQMYRAAHSNMAMVRSTLTRTVGPDSKVVAAHLTITYEFLGRLPQLSITRHSDTLLEYSSTDEFLSLVVIPLN
ncbi:unnamed protein product [Phytophthora fragariaefolia]|uniref:Unnamed protein product n=1 Tax=Phytophthora fragariaefolia TaxID=1490495 RepID=A0A9W6XK90_9STRA|nr:unnamed protein product [Phytophthora fragariaefolia]